jgi:hypothetical protein
MDARVTFVGSFRIRDYAAWLPAMEAMTRFVADRVPGVLSFHAYVNDEHTRGTVIYVHRDADSLDMHLALAAERIQAGTQMVEVMSIQLFGSPHQTTVDALRQSGTPVEVSHVVDGFSR